MKKCTSCNAKNEDDAIFCENCGEEIREVKNKMQWEIYVPLFKSPIILKELFFAIGIPFGILILFLIFISKGDIMGTDTKYALLLIGLLFLFTFILIMAVYGGKYGPGFILDEGGITNYTIESHAKKSKIINGLLIFLGMFSNNPTSIGIGLMANSKIVTKISWKKIRNIRYYPASSTIVVKGGYGDKIAIFCNKDNYLEVEDFIKHRAVIQDGK